MLDRYILAKTREMIDAVQDRLDHYDVPGAYAAVPAFIDALNNWYIRRSRSRFSAEGTSADKQDAFDTLYTVLTLSCRALAPCLPFVTERIYTALTGAQSVHLADWPDITKLPEEAILVHQMDLAREVCSATLTSRGAPPAGAVALAQAHGGASRGRHPRTLQGHHRRRGERQGGCAVRYPGAHGKRELKVDPKIGAKISAE